MFARASVGVLELKSLRAARRRSTYLTGYKAIRERSATRLVRGSCRLERHGEPGGTITRLSGSRVEASSARTTSPGALGMRGPSRPRGGSYRGNFTSFPSTERPVKAMHEPPSRREQCHRARWRRASGPRPRGVFWQTQARQELLDVFFARISCAGPGQRTFRFGDRPLELDPIAKPSGLRRVSEAEATPATPERCGVARAPCG